MRGVLLRSAGGPRMVLGYLLLSRLLRRHHPADAAATAASAAWGGRGGAQTQRIGHAPRRIRSRQGDKGRLCHWRGGLRLLLLQSLLLLHQLLRH